MDARSPIIVRPAAERDAASIAGIYNQGIAERVATFETEPRTPEQVERLLEEGGQRYPAVVAELDGRVVAWARAGPYSERSCYAGIGEFSVYADRAYRGRGAGQAALVALITLCEQQGFWKLVGRIFPENEPSLRLCRTLGFREVGTHRRHARLDGEWRDVVIVEKLLGEAEEGV
jgi:phosphinothricin acetyltransferase